ncbi:hypothetical protein ASZ78_016348 [Callipepla squamata]|uniref:Uncharacterized protein n=1 Tax=Callipepla squamata TaxID=9009 RepID=A0A226N7E6_CALSU|nr:hypothetical protein ASZ78_016348 [Callipepla squamata]
MLQERIGTHLAWNYVILILLHSINSSEFARSATDISAIFAWCGRIFNFGMSPIMLLCLLAEEALIDCVGLYTCMYTHIDFTNVTA